MIIFSALQLRRGTTLLLNNASAVINPQQKVGLVGKNGCGKSTLFTLIKGEITADAGEISVPHHWSIASVAQEIPSLERSAIDYVMDGDHEFRLLEQQLSAANKANDGYKIANLHNQLDNIQAWTIHARAATLLKGLGFSDAQFTQPVTAFSGGWQMRLNLAQALICRSDLLLLDEPTNHLDLDAIIWLELWLKNYPGTLILVSHDRDFLDPIVNRILHIDQQQLVEYSGNYSYFEQLRAANLMQQQSLYRHQQQKIAHLQHYIDRFRAKASKAKQAQSRLKMLEKMEKITPAYTDSPFQFQFHSAQELPHPLLHMKNVSVGYNNRVILDTIQLDLVPGSRIGLLGRNGAGKSTLIKLLAGQLKPLEGHFHFSAGVKLGYFAQHQLELLQPETSPLAHLKMLDSSKTEQQLRSYLGGFGFKEDKVYQPVGSFSGGEKTRLVLALIVWQRPNLLLLDEPTNHLDLDMRQALTEALIDFSGALVVISHDRHLLRSTVDAFYLVNEHKVTFFDGDLDDYQRWITQQANKSNTLDKPSNDKMTVISSKEKKRLAAEKRTQKMAAHKELLVFEQQMVTLDSQLKEIAVKLANQHLYSVEHKQELMECIEKQATLQKQLERVEIAWLALQEKQDQLD